MNSKKIAVISDVHSNYEALETVISHAAKESVHDVWFLGDAVGYGPDPQRCLKLLQKTVRNTDAWILGNHDEVMRYPPNGMISDELNREPTSRFSLAHIHPIMHQIGSNSDTFMAFKMNYEILDVFPDRRNYLLAHHATSRIGQRFMLVHGGVRSGTPTTTYTTDRIQVQKEFWLSVFKITSVALKQMEAENVPNGILSALEPICGQEIIGEEKFLETLRPLMADPAAEQYEQIIVQHAFLTHKRRYHDSNLHIVFFGHTHHPVCFKGARKSIGGKVDFRKLEFGDQTEIQLDEKHAWFFNPGSVGQPRDGDPRASYMVLDQGNFTLQLHRVTYNIGATQKQMGDYNMPVNLIKRLASGR